MKTKILNKTREMLMTVTFNSLSLSKLSNECGIAKSTLYHYFESKDAIYKKLLIDITDNHYKSVKKIYNLEIDNFDKIKMIIDYYFNMSFEDIKILDEEIYINYLANMEEETFRYFNNILEMWNDLLDKENINTNQKILFDLLIVSSRNHILKEKFQIISKKLNLESFKIINMCQKETKEEIISNLLEIINKLKG